MDKCHCSYSVFVPAAIEAHPETTVKPRGQPEAGTHYTYINTEVRNVYNRNILPSGEEESRDPCPEC